jgi:hypothetical protein
VDKRTWQVLVYGERTKQHATKYDRLLLYIEFEKSSKSETPNIYGLQRQRFIPMIPPIFTLDETLTFTHLHGPTAATAT